MSLIAAPNLRPAPARQPHDLQPANHPTVSALLESLGFVIPSGRLNQTFLSRWSFTMGDTLVACLWWAAMDRDEEGVFTTINLYDEPPGSARRLTEKKKAQELFAALSRARERAQAVTVIIVDRDDYSLAGLEDAVRVQRRALDTVAWWVTDTNEEVGEVTLRRDGVISEGRWTAREAKPTVRLSNDPEAIAADLVDIETRTDVSETTRVALREARLGQGAFRGALIERWGGRCPLTDCSILAALRASHIVPWRDATDEERLDPNNGLLLSASADALFDRGLLTFEDYGPARLAQGVDEREVLRLVKRLRLPQLTPKELGYLRRHRENYFDRAEQTQVSA